MPIPVGSRSTSQVSVQLRLPLFPPEPFAQGLMAVISPGFLVDPSAYLSYSQALTSAGVPTAIYNVPQTATAPLDDVCHAEVRYASLQGKHARTEGSFRLPLSPPSSAGAAGGATLV